MTDSDKAEQARSDTRRIQSEIRGDAPRTDPFVAAVRATRMPMIITDPRQPDNPIVFANDSFCRMTGYSADEITGRNCRFLQGVDTDPASVGRIREAIASRQQIEIDIRNHRKTGEPFWNRLLISPVYDAAGELAYFFASQLDVTLERERLQNLEASNAELVAELGRKLNEKQVSEDELKFTLAAGRFGSWSLDLGSMALTASETCRENFGFGSDDRFAYEDLIASVHPADRQRMQASVAKSIESRSDYSIEYRIITPSGEHRAVAIRGRPVYASDGTALKMAGISLDITERVRSDRMKEGLADLSERLTRIDQTQDISYAAGEILGKALDVDRAGYGTVDGEAETITIERDWNAEGVHSLAGVLQFRDYGSYIEDLVRGDIVAFADAECDPRTRESAQALKAISAQAVVNMPVVENGQTVALFYLNHGRPRKWREDELSFLREVASRTRTAVERRKVEVELRAVNDRLTFLDELGKAAADAIDAEHVMAITTRLVGQKMKVSICAYADMETDQDHFTIRGDWSAEGSGSIVGRYSLAAFGRLAVSELRAGRPLIINDNLKEIAPEEAHTFQNIGITATICMPLVKDGVLTALMAIHDRNARYWTDEELALIRDVTDRSWAHVERVRSEAKLRDLNATLESRVDERTRQLMQAEEALRQAQKMEAVGQLTGGVAHDFNNLLTIISSSVDFLRRPQLSDDRRTRYVNAISDTVSRASKLTHQLLAFARRQSLKPEAFDVGRQVEDVLELFRPLVGGLIDIQFEKINPACFAIADVGQFETALMNLAVNARDAMNGEGRITIRLANVDRIPAVRSHPERVGQFAAISLSDNGIGIPANRLEQVFEPFYTTKEVGQGTGLGLSQVFGFAKQSGGEIMVESTPGEGATFTIFLPKGDGPSSHASSEPLVRSGHGRGRRILIVEDNVEVGEFSSETLQDLGYQTVWARSGPEALEILTTTTAEFDLVFSDVIMPGMNGVELAQQIMKLHPNLAIVLTSGYSEVLADEGSHGFELIRKPYSADALAVVLNRAISLSAAAR